MHILKNPRLIEYEAIGRILKSCRNVLMNH